MLKDIIVHWGRQGGTEITTEHGSGPLEKLRDILQMFLGGQWVPAVDIQGPVKKHGH
jgi:hypothetical protein